MQFSKLFQKIFAPRKRIIGATDLQRALNRDEFVFYYQPEWDLKTNKIKGVEALIRWESPNGIIPPNEFIPVLEETGLINSFTPFLLNQTLSDLKELHNAGFDNLFVSINLSVIQLRDPNLAETVQKTLDAHGILPEYLECEVTESQEFSPNGTELATVKNLQKSGIKFSIDDFGTGHASFNYIKDLDTHKLKIDREFVRDLFDRKANQTIIRTMIELGHSLDFIVLAEGVETPEQAKWLKDNRCDYAQGFLVSRPLPLPMLVSFLRSYNPRSKSKRK